jgi:DoxX-like family
MNLALWIIAGLLAALMLTAAAKLFLPKEKLAKLATRSGYGWMSDNSVGFVKTIGALELLAAVGLVLPAALDIAPILVPLAAVGVVLLMVGAMITHLRRDEAVPAVLNLTYLAMAAFVAWGRFGPESFSG